jgi:hypothetical protein
LFISSFAASAQNFSEWEAISFNKAEDYRKHEGTVLDISNYILNTPRKADDRNQVIAFRTLLKWMSGTPDYSFSLDNSLDDVMKNNEDVLGIYMASMTKYVLENKDKAKDAKAVKLNAFTTMLSYCEKEGNGIKQTKGMKKALEAKNKGELAQYLHL